MATSLVSEIPDGVPKFLALFVGDELDGVDNAALLVDDVTCASTLIFASSFELQVPTPLFEWN